MHFVRPVTMTKPHPDDDHHANDHHANDHHANDHHDGSPRFDLRTTLSRRNVLVGMALARWDWRCR